MSAADQCVLLIPTSSVRSEGIAARFKVLAADSVMYGASASISKVLGVITFPILARQLSVEDFGLFDYLNALSAFLAILFVFGQDSGVARYLYEHTGKAAQRQLVSQSLAFQVSLLVVGVPATVVFLTRAGDGALGVEGRPSLLLMLMMLQVPLLVLANFSQNLLRWTNCRTQFMVLTLGSTSVSVVGMVLGASYGGLGVVDVFLILGLVRASFAMLGLWFVRPWLEWPTGTGFLKEASGYSWAYGVISSVGLAYPLIERSIVGLRLGDDALGLFAAGAKVAMLIALPISAFQMAWGPLSLAIRHEAGAVETYNWVLKSLAVVTFSLVLALAALSEPLLHLLASDRFSGGATVVFGLAMGAALQGLGWITELGITFSKRSYLKIIGYAVSLVVSLVMSILLVGPFGVVGVAWGSMLGLASKSVVETWLAQRVHPLSWKFSGVVLLAVITAIVGLLGQIASAKLQPWLGSMVYGGGAVLLPVVSAWVVFDSQERGRIRALLSTMTRRFRVVGIL